MAPKKRLLPSELFPYMRMISDGTPIREAAEGSGLKYGSMRAYASKFNITRGSFLDDHEIHRRMSMYNKSSRGIRTRREPDIPEPVWQGVEPVKPAPAPVKPLKHEEPRPQAIRPVTSEDTGLSIKTPYPTVSIGDGLSDEEKQARSESIRLMIGDKAINDLHNGVVALLNATTEKLKHVESQDEAVQLVSTAMAVRSLMDMVDSPLLIDNWNDAAKAVAMIREGCGIHLRDNLFEKMVTAKLNKDANKGGVDQKINVTILSQSPAKVQKTFDAEVVEG